MSARAIRSVSCAVMLVLVPALSFGFGKNKLGARTEPWLSRQSPHFILHYPESLSDISERVLTAAELLVLRYNDEMRHELRRRVPIILFPSHADFAENNVTPFLVGEGTGGFTELLKSRVVLPYEGSWDRLYRVLAHELVHAYQFDILNIKGAGGGLLRSFPPLWVFEGMAEHFSIGWDRESEVIIRDALFTGTLPTLTDLHEDRYPMQQYILVYKLSQAFFQYLSRRFGPSLPADFFKLAVAGQEVDAALRRLTGFGLERLSREFDDDLRKFYLPAYASFLPLSADWFATDHLKDRSGRNLRPTLSPDGRRMAYFSDRDPYPGLFILDLTDRENRRRAVTGGRSDRLQSLVFERNRPAWRPDGKALVFLSRSGTGDLIHIYDTEQEEIVRSFPSPCLETGDPDFSPDGRRVIFSGIRGVAGGLWILDIEAGTTRLLLENKGPLRNPRWLNDREILCLAPTNGQTDGPLYLHRVPAVSAEPVRAEPLAVPGEAIVRFAVAETRLLYVPDRPGRQDLFTLSLQEQRSNGGAHRLTQVSGAVSFPELSADGKRAAFSHYSRFGYNVCEFPLPTATNAAIRQWPAQPVEQGYGTQRLAEDQRRQARWEPYYQPGDPLPYGSGMDLDVIGGLIGFSSQAGLRLIGQFAMSDMLGDRRLSALLDLSLSKGDEAWNRSSINFIANYLLLDARIDLVIGAFSYGTGMIVYDLEALLQSAFTPSLYHKQAGGYLQARWPLSRFMRLDAVWTSMHMEKYYLDFSEVRGSGMHLLETSWTYDNSLMSPYGPVDGVRARVSLGKAFGIEGHSWGFQQANIDLRGYLLFFRRFAFALRLSGGMTGGPDKDYARYELGGFDSVRGHGFFSIRGHNMLLGAIEFRFPFIDFLALGFPLPLALGGIRGVFFFDAAMAWDGGADLQPTETREDGKTYFRDIKAGMGVGFRILLGPFRIRWDFATPFDGRAPRPLKKWQGLFSLGLDF